MEVDLVKEGGGSDETSAPTNIIVVQNWLDPSRVQQRRPPRRIIQPNFTPMSLQPGTRLGVYEVTALIGQGGRGPALELAERSPATVNSYENAPVTRFPRGSEVYRARDTKGESS